VLAPERLRKADLQESVVLVVRVAEEVLVEQPQLADFVLLAHLVGHAGVVGDAGGSGLAVAAEQQAAEHPLAEQVIPLAAVLVLEHSEVHLPLQKLICHLLQQVEVLYINPVYLAFNNLLIQLLREIAAHVLQQLLLPPSHPLLLLPSLTFSLLFPH